MLRPDLVAASLIFWPYADAEGLHLPLYSIGWTLDFEVFFYFIFAFGLIFRQSIGVPLVAGGLLSFVLIGSLQILPETLRFLTNSILIDFLFGMGLGKAYLAGWRLTPCLAVVALLVAAVVFLAATLAGFNAVPNAPDQFPRWIAWGFPAALLFTGTVLRVERAAAPRPALILLGDASYALYLLHPLVIICMRPLLSVLMARLAGLPSGFTAACWLFLITSLASSVLGALAIHLWFERPLARWLRRGWRPDQF